MRSSEHSLHCELHECSLLLDTQGLKQHLFLLSESESHSVVSTSATPWTEESMEFSRPEYWSG